MPFTRLAPGDPAYPALLGVAPAPPALWIRGELRPADALAVAIVGARRATPYGLEVAEQLAGDLARCGITIVSGFARGIDTAAHRGALAAGGRTLAVLGNGIDVVYPRENRQLAAAVERQGALLSQFEPGTLPLPYHFPARNRTMAGLSLGVVVVEATAQSGALITAGFAGDLGREVFAIPGKITAETSAGPHALLRDGAILVRTWQDVVQDLPEPWRSTVVLSRAVVTANDRPEPGDRDRGILALLADGEPQHIEQLISRSQHDAAAVSAALVALEMDGWVRPLEGQRWVTVRRRR